MSGNKIDEMEVVEHKNKSIIKYIVIEVIWLLYFIGVTYMENKVGYIYFEELSSANILRRFIQDALILLLPSIVVMAFFRKRWSEIGIKKNEIVLCFLLFGIYVLFFFLRGDYSHVEGCYKFLFCLCLTAFGEEMWSRGFIYLQIKKYNKIVAVIISGAFFGIAHSILPAILQNYTTGELIGSMSSQIGGGIVGGLIFIFYLEYAGTIFIPILIHALLDYSYGKCGLFVAIVTAIYLFVKRMIERKGKTE